MTLSSIKSMFIPGDYWSVQYSGESTRERPPYRQVHKATGELVWDYGGKTHFHTPWPKATEVVEASPGRLVFRYSHHTETFTFTKLSGPDAATAADHIATFRTHNQARIATEAAQKAAEKQRTDSTARLARENTIRNREPITGEDLIQIFRDHDLPISPRTIGSLRKHRVHNISPDSWTIRSHKKPRYTYETQPSILYMRLYDHLLLQDLAAPISTPEPSDPALDHLFGKTTTPPPISALDLFAA